MYSYPKIILETGICFEVFDQMLDEVLFFDAGAKLIYINPAAERSEGYTLEKSYGKSLFELYDFENDVRMDTSPANIALRERRSVRNMICTYYAGGIKKTKTINSTPIFKDGELVGVFNIQHDLTQFSTMIDENLELQSKINRRRLQQQKDEENSFQELIGSCEAFSHSLSLARKAAKTDSAILLIGEEGCGKNSFARAIHEGSSRAEMPFISINCASIPEDLFDSVLFGMQNRHYSGPNSDGILMQVNGGTLYIENVTYMPEAVQMKLLRIFEERMFTGITGSEVSPVDIRLICSSSESPTEIMRWNRLRMEFFYCISVVQIRIPSLIERKEDIPMLTRHFLQEFNQRFGKNIVGVDSDVMSWFKIYHWPGNIRQFRSCIEASMNFVEDGREINVDDLPANIFYGTRHSKAYFNGNSDKSSPELREKRESPDAVKTDSFSKRKLYLDAREKEQTEIIEALKETNGNISQAARLLGISRQLVHYRMKKYHIE